MKKRKYNVVDCLWCGKAFYQQTAHHVYCCRNSYDSARAKIIKDRTSYCKICGSPYDSRKHESLYCSNECWRIDQGRKLLRYCVICGQMFMPWKCGIYHDFPVTCCEKCAKIYAFQQEQIRREKISVAFKGKNHPQWLGGKITFRGENWQWNRKRALERDQYKCKHCGITNKQHKKKWKCSLEVHHIKPFRFFDSAEEANQLENLISLCTSCHKLAEMQYYREHPNVKHRKDRDSF